MKREREPTRMRLAAVRLLEGCGGWNRWGGQGRVMTILGPCTIRSSSLAPVEDSFSGAAKPRHTHTHTTPYESGGRWADRGRRYNAG